MNPCSMSCAIPRFGLKLNVRMASSSTVLRCFAFSKRPGSSSMPGGAAAVDADADADADVDVDVDADADAADAGAADAAVLEPVAASSTCAAPSSVDPTGSSIRRPIHSTSERSTLQRHSRLWRFRRTSTDSASLRSSGTCAPSDPGICVSRDITFMRRSYRFSSAVRSQS